MAKRKKKSKRTTYSKTIAQQLFEAAKTDDSALMSVLKIFSPL